FFFFQAEDGIRDLIVTGVQTCALPISRPVAFLLAGEMAVAYFIGHGSHGFWTVLNQGTPAVIYCFVWLYLSAAGAGPWSLDARRSEERRVGKECRSGRARCN